MGRREGQKEGEAAAKEEGKAKEKKKSKGRVKHISIVAALVWGEPMLEK